VVRLPRRCGRAKLTAVSRFRCVGFLTDYGLEDGFVAVCHGVVGRIAPEARIVDIGHLVPAYDVRRGAAVLARAAPYLDPAVFLAVVDPGVGSDRRSIALSTESSVLVGPDNGLLLPAADRLGGVRRAVVLDRDALFAQPVSATFHGRDVFAPVAAHLFTGTGLDDVGSPIDPAGLVRLPEPRVVAIGDGVEAEVVDVDHYGNLQLAAAWEDLDATHGKTVRVETASTADVAHVGRQFASVGSGELVVYADSDGRVAVAINGGSAAARLAAGPGDVVRVSRRRARTPDR
jgi:S-adenosyl-L-methionine hydrolase (adenosine-forming)